MTDRHTEDDHYEGMADFVTHHRWLLLYIALVATISLILLVVSH